MEEIKKEKVESKEKEVKTKEEYKKPKVTRMRRIVGAGGHKG